jgi:hypothetical protein
MVLPMDALKTALSIGNAKEAAIYFDYVVSLVFALDLLSSDDKSGIPKAEYESELETELGFLKVLEPESIRASTQFREQMMAAQESWLNFLIEIMADPGLGGISDEAAAQRYFVALNDVVARQHRSLRSVGLDAAPVVLPSRPFLVVNDGRARDIAFTISGIQVVDASGTSWQQVMEFRKNPDNLRKLRRLRLFAYEDYADKSLSYIEEDLGRKVDEHRRAVRAGGFATIPGTFTVNLTSKAIATGRYRTLLSAVFGTPAFGAIAAVKGATVEIGALKLEVSRRRFELRGTLIGNPISYATVFGRPKAGAPSLY